MCFALDCKAFLDKELGDGLGSLLLLPQHSPLLSRRQAAYTLAQRRRILLFMVVGIRHTTKAVLSSHLHAIALVILAQILQVAVFLEGGLDLFFTLDASLFESFRF